MNFDLDILKDRLNKRGFNSFVCCNKAEAVSVISDTLLGEDNLIVGMGNSATLRELGIKDILNTRTVYEHTPIGSEDSDRKALHADIYFTSANALSYDGHIINIDGTGNRTSATCFGPKHVVYVIGKNKIADTLENAIERAKNTAVALAKKYGRKTPCVVTNKCEDCISPECICGVMTIHRKKLFGNKISVILVNEDLGI